MNGKIKPYYDKNRTLLNKVVPLETPFTINIQASTFCNIRCKYCFHSFSESRKKAHGFNSRIMDFGLFTLILGQIKQFPQKTKVISFTGMGEPLCNMKLHEMINMVKKADVTGKTNFFTNALLLSKETALALIDAGLDEIRISLQGMNSEKYYEVCGARINFNELVENINYFYQNKKNCKVYIKVADTALEKNEHELFYKTFQNICDSMFIEHILPQFEGVNYNDIISDTSNHLNRLGEKKLNFAVCPPVFYYLNILPNGDVIPCCDYFNPVVGNVKDESLLEIWNGQKRLEFIKMQLRKERFNNPVCKNCIVPYDFHKEDNVDNYTDEILKRMEEA